MRGNLTGVIESIRASFWFVPSVMAASAVLLSVVTVALDQRGTSEWLGRSGFIYLNQPGGARSLLSTIAGSIMNVAGVVFSLTIVALTLASQQFGPRLLGNFMRDRGNQLVLGIFIATFLYCLLILRTVRGDGDTGDAFVPHLSIAVALLITLAALAATIYFIHHIASSIQVQSVIGKVALSLAGKVSAGDDRDIFPARLGRDDDGKSLPAGFDGRSRSVRAERSGYLQAIDARGLLRATERHDAIVRLRLRPGSFVMKGQRILDVYPSGLPAGAVEQLAGMLSFGAGRTQRQDAESLFDQLLELSLRALSPASNDPITAGACVDRICDSLLELGRGRLPSPFRADEDGSLRVIVPPLELDELARRLFSSLRSSLASDLLAATHAMEVLRQLGEETENEDLAVAVTQERSQLLAACRDGLSALDYRTLLERTVRPTAATCCR